MESKIILTKGSSSEEIKNYFQAILKLSQADNEFPINLDEVWPLVYSEKSKAVRALKNDFIEGIDYQSFAQNGKREIGATITHVYYLSLPCLEFFIARKVRPVFEVYRQVFHGVAQGQLTNFVKTKSANLYSIEEKVEYISICKDSGFYVWEVSALVGNLLESIQSMEELRKVMTLISEKQVLETNVLQIVMSLYAREKGLPSTKAPCEQSGSDTPKIPSVTKRAEKLPPYTRAKDYTLRSMKNLLEEKGYKGIYAHEVMEALYHQGYVRKVVFNGSNRWEWTLTTEGSPFGRNTAHRSGMSVRPKWLCGKFDQMMRKIGYSKENRKEACHD